MKLTITENKDNQVKRQSVEHDAKPEYRFIESRTGYGFVWVYYRSGRRVATLSLVGLRALMKSRASAPLLSDLS